MWIVPWTEDVAPSAEVCEISLANHEVEPDEEWVFRLTMSTPDRSRRSRIERVTLGVPLHDVPPGSPVTAVHELDLLKRFVDPASDADPPLSRVADQWLDWGRWPLDFTFVGPDVRGPTQLAEYHLHTRPEATRADWASCILQLGGPTRDACTIVTQVRGPCLADWERRERLR
jgi:hypothetical protein